MKPLSGLKLPYRKWLDELWLRTHRRSALQVNTSPYYGLLVSVKALMTKLGKVALPLVLRPKTRAMESLQRRFPPPSRVVMTFHRLMAPSHWMRSPCRISTGSEVVGDGNGLWILGGRNTSPNRSKDYDYCMR